MVLDAARTLRRRSLGVPRPARRVAGVSTGCAGATPRWFRATADAARTTGRSPAEHERRAIPGVRERTVARGRQTTSRFLRSASALAGARPTVRDRCSRPAGWLALPTRTSCAACRGEPVQQTRENRAQNEETQKTLAFTEASTHERSRSPESAFTFTGIGVHIHRNSQSSRNRNARRPARRPFVGTKRALEMMRSSHSASGTPQPSPRVACLAGAVDQPSIHAYLGQGAWYGHALLLPGAQRRSRLSRRQSAALHGYDGPQVASTARRRNAHKIGGSPG